MGAFDLPRPPDRVRAWTETGAADLVPTAEGWASEGISVTLAPSGEVSVRAPAAALLGVHLQWRRPDLTGMSCLGDCWERAYGDLGWRRPEPGRTMPWYVLARDGESTHGVGVAVRPAAFCAWQADDGGLGLRLDLRCGGSGVRLGERTLEACRIVARRGEPGEPPFEAARAFLRLLCGDPRLPAAPVYGGNDWYYAYGANRRENLLRDAGMLAELAPSGPVRPVQMVDAGWSSHARGEEAEGGPWREGNARFPDMPGLARAVRDLGVVPALWFRPLRVEEPVPEGLLLPEGRVPGQRGLRLLDPTVPEVLEGVRRDVGRFRAWGYGMLKHDFSTWDALGRWGFEMGGSVTPDGWTFRDRALTSAEALTGLYRAVREGAGDLPVIACNAVGHLAAGLAELQRIGDDNGGRAWERTRKMGLNALAFRGVQHGALFAADADCAPLTPAVPWAFSRQWLDLLSRSGTPLFVSADPVALDRQQREAVREAFARAAVPQPLAEPLDWLGSATPAAWRCGGGTRRYDWF